MEEARARGNEIIDQHQKALEGVFKTHKTRSCDAGRYEDQDRNSIGKAAVKYSNIQRAAKTSKTIKPSAE